MKKLVSLFLLVALFLSVPNCEALAAKPKIDFRGIPFGTSFTDTKAALKKENLLIDESSIRHWYAPYKMPNSSYIEEGRVGETINDSFYCEIDDAVLVAGYKAQASLWFIYTNKTNKKEPPIDGASFYKAMYYISDTLYEDSPKLPRNSSVALEDFKNKLESIYGDADEHDFNYYIWKGKGDTYIKLKAVVFADSTYHLEITYGWEKGDEIMLQRQDEIIENRGLSSGVDGL